MKLQSPLASGLYMVEDTSYDPDKKKIETLKNAKLLLSCDS